MKNRYHYLRSGTKEGDLPRSDQKQTTTPTRARLRASKYQEDATPGRRIFSPINHGQYAPVTLDDEAKSSARDYVEKLISNIRGKAEVEQPINDEKEIEPI